MDPLSALSAAAAVIQFIDFGSRLILQTHQAYKSVTGQTERAAALSQIARDLTEFSDSVQDKAGVLSKPVQVGSNETFLRLCRECKDISSELLAVLNGLQAKGTTKFDFAKSSFAVAVKSVLTEGRIKTLSGRMAEARQQTMLAALACLWYID